MERHHTFHIGLGMRATHTDGSYLAGYTLDLLIWSVTLTLAVLVGGYLIYLLWQEAGRLQTKRSRAGKGIKLLSLISGIVIMAFSVMLVVQAPLLFRIKMERMSYDDFTMTPDLFGEVLYIDGLIGPSFAGRLKNALKENPEIREIHITSFGGLVDQALEAASLIEDRPGLTVIARNLCDSACIIVLMAADNRIADRDMMLGFHRPVPIIDIPESLIKFSGMRSKADDYLVSRGVPQEIIDHRDASGKNALKMIPATSLAELGVINGFTENSSIAAASSSSSSQPVSPDSG